MKNELTVIEPTERQIVPVMERLLEAVQSGLSIEMLEKFMALSERQEKREAEKAFHRAFAAFKADPPQIVKDKLVSFSNTKYKHATLGAVVSGIIGGMSKHGLSHRWDIEQDGATITVTCFITHELGHTEKTSMSAGADVSGGKNAIQAIASTVHYLERYTIQAATGIAVLENDDDGSGAVGITQPPKKQKGEKQKDQPKETDRTAVEAWKKWTDGFTDPRATLDYFTEQWESQALPAMKAMSKDHQSELLIAKNEMAKFLMEREAKK